jgi:hypothetical protein
MQAKTYGVPVVVGGETVASAGGRGLDFLPLDRVRVKGKRRPVDVFALLGGPGRPPDPGLVAHAPAVERLVAAFRAGDLRATEAALGAVEGARHPVLDGLAAIYRERLAALPGGAFPADWDGAVTLTMK